MAICSRGVLLRVDEHMQDPILERAKAERAIDPCFPDITRLNEQHFFVNDVDDTHKASWAVEVLKRRLGGAVTVFDWDYVSESDDNNDDENEDMVYPHASTMPFIEHHTIDKVKRADVTVRACSPTDSIYDSDDMERDMCEPDMWLESEGGENPRKRKRGQSESAMHTATDTSSLTRENTPRLSPKRSKGAHRHQRKDSGVVLDTTWKHSRRIEAHLKAIELDKNSVTAKTLEKRDRALRQHSDFVTTLQDPRGDLDQPIRLCPLDHYFDLSTGKLVDDGVHFSLASNVHTNTYRECK